MQDIMATLYIMAGGRICLDRAPSNYFLFGGGFPPLAFLFFPKSPFVFDVLSNHVWVEGCLKMVGKGPAKPTNFSKMSSDYAVQA